MMDIDQPSPAIAAVPKDMCHIMRICVGCTARDNFETALGNALSPSIARGDSRIHIEPLYEGQVFLFSLFTSDIYETLEAVRQIYTSGIWLATNEYCVVLSRKTETPNSPFSESGRASYYLRITKDSDWEPLLEKDSPLLYRLARLGVPQPEEYEIGLLPFKRNPAATYWGEQRDWMIDATKPESHWIQQSKVMAEGNELDPALKEKQDIPLSAQCNEAFEKRLQETIKASEDLAFREAGIKYIFADDTPKLVDEMGVRCRKCHLAEPEWMCRNTECEQLAYCQPCYNEVLTTPVADKCFHCRKDMGFERL